MNANTKAALQQFDTDQTLKKLELLLRQFNIFEAIKIKREEKYQSNLLAFLLDPSEKHGLNDIFLRRFLKALLPNAKESPLSEDEINNLNLTDTYVRLETIYHVDIFVDSPQDKIACIIENKVDATEHNNQLERYEKIIREKFPDYTLYFIYLTPKGQLPIRDEEQKSWLACSYEKITKILDDTCQQDKNKVSSEVSVLMSHYAGFIRRYIVEDIEISELCKKIYKQHNEAIELIFKYRHNLEEKIAHYIEVLINDAINKGHDIEYDSRCSDIKRIRFAVSEWDNFDFQEASEPWDDSDNQRILRFEFQYNPSEITLLLILGPGNFILRQAIYETLELHKDKLSGFIPSKLTKRTRWNTLIKQAVSERSEDSIEIIQDKIQVAWNSFLETDLPLIKEAITNSTLLLKK